MVVTVASILKKMVLQNHWAHSLSIMSGCNENRAVGLPHGFRSPLVTSLGDFSSTLKEETGFRRGHYTLNKLVKILGQIIKEQRLQGTQKAAQSQMSGLLEQLEFLLSF